MRLISQSFRQSRRPRGRRGNTNAHNALLARIVVVATLLLFAALAKADRSQTAVTLSQIKRVYVGSLGDKQGATELRDRLINRLRKARGIELVANRSEADAVITGTGEIWLKGYIRTNPKSIPWNRQAVYSGYLAVEVEAKDDTTLWEYRAAPGKFQWNGVAQDVVNRLAKKLLEALRQNSASTW